MALPTNAPTLLDSTPIPVQARIAAAWTSLMFLYAYVDIYNFYKPGVVDGILAGLVFEFEVSAPLLTAFVALLAVPALMVMLSVSLPARVNRAANLVVASLYVPFTVFNAVGETGEWAVFYVVSIGIELALLAMILRSAWAWPRVAVAPSDLAATEDRQSL